MLRRTHHARTQSGLHRRLRVERLEDRRLLAAAGDLDPTFDGDGRLTTDFPGGSDNAHSVVIQTDGKIVAAGLQQNASNFDFALARYNANGALDTSFDSDGMVTTAIGAGSDYAESVLLQPDGKIVAAGRASNDFGVARYNSNGSLDTGFDVDGKVTTDFEFGLTDNAWGAVLQPDGKIVVAGATASDFGTNLDFALARYNANGSLDTTFDGDGKVITAFGTGDDEIRAVALQADGKIVVAGYSANSAGTTWDFAVARYNANGSLDTTFDGDGKVTTSFTIVPTVESIVIQADGKILVAGTDGSGSGRNFALARYNANGSLDTSFDGDGKLTIDFGMDRDDSYAMALQPNGKVIVAGYGRNGLTSDFAMARLNTNGSLDTSFGGDGKVTSDFGPNEEVWGVALQADGKIVVAGYSGTTFALARYEGNNSPTNPGAAALTSINEDTPAASVAGTLVSTIVTSSGSTDLDGQSLGIAVTAADNANGQWQYSTNGGGAWQNLTGLSTATARLLAPAHLVRFVPNAHFNSQIAATTIGFKTWDQTSGTAGLTGDTTSASAFSASAGTATQTVNAINDAPSFALLSTLVSRNEDAGAVTVSNFATNIARGPAAATDENGQSLTFLVSVTGTTGGLTFSAAPAINSATGALTFTTSANSNGSATVEAVLQDNGSASAPNVNASAAQAFTIQIAAVNDEQVLATNTGLPVDRAASATITSARLSTTDIDDTPGDLVYTVTSGPSHGTVRVSGTPVSTFTQQQINAGQVSYLHNGSANFADSFTFNVNDGEGTSSGGTFSITIEPRPGDYNRDHVIDAADYVMWRKQLGATGVPAYSGADGDGNGAVQQADHGVWTAHFGETFGVGSAEGGAGSAGPEAVGQAVPDDLASAQPAPVRQSLTYAADSPSRRAVGSRVVVNALSTAVRDDALVAWLASRGADGADVRREEFIEHVDDAREWNSESLDEALDAVFASLVL